MTIINTVTGGSRIGDISFAHPGIRSGNGYYTMTSKNKMISSGYTGITEHYAVRLSYTGSSGRLALTPIIIRGLDTPEVTNSTSSSYYSFGSSPAMGGVQEKDGIIRILFGYSLTKACAYRYDPINAKWLSNDTTTPGWLMPGGGYIVTRYAENYTFIKDGAEVWSIKGYVGGMMMPFGDGRPVIVAEDNHAYHLTETGPVDLGAVENHNLKVAISDGTVVVAVAGKLYRNGTQILIFPTDYTGAIYTDGDAVLWCTRVNDVSGVYDANGTHYPGFVDGSYADLVGTFTGYNSFILIHPRADYTEITYTKTSASTGGFLCADGAFILYSV